MRETLSFAAWLGAAPASWFDRIARTRADLLRTDAVDVRRFATLAASRAAAAAGLELLEADALRIVHRAAVLSRIDPAVSREELPLEEDSSPALAEAALTSAIAAGLLWPAHREDAGTDRGPSTASAYRVHPEAAALLPVTAAARAQPLSWDQAHDPRPLTVRRVPAALLENAQAAGVAGALARTIAVCGEFARHEVSQLASGGVGKRDTQTLARAVGADQARFTLAAELAAGLGWLSITHDPSDPQWKPTPAFDTAVAAPREDVWAQLVTAWLTHPVDVVHVLAGVTPAGERIHLLSRDDHSRTAFSGFPVSRPQILLLRRLVLVSLLDADVAEAKAADAKSPDRNGPVPGAAVAEADLLALLAFAHPLLAVVTAEEVAQVLDEAESFGLTASPLGDSHAHALTPLGRTLATWLQQDAAGGRRSPGHRPVDAQADSPVLPQSVTDQVADLLPALETTVTLQSDLTAVAAGPLDHRVQARLEAVAAIDTRGQGTVFRITDDTITGALRAGRSAESVLGDLEELSATGVPSTLRHMVESQASRLHRIRVAGARSVIVVDDPADLDVIFDDPASTATGMRRLSPTVAVSDAPPDRVTALVETEDRPVLRAETESRGARPDRAPVPVRPDPPITRTRRIPPSETDAHIARLLADRDLRPGEKRPDGVDDASAAAGPGQARAGGAAAGSGAAAGARAESAGNTTGNAGATGSVESGAGTDTVVAELSEAAAVKAAVDLVVATSDGTRRLIRMVPEAVRAGRLLGRSGTGSAVRIAVARIVEVRRA